MHVSPSHAIHIAKGKPTDWLVYLCLGLPAGAILLPSHFPKMAPQPLQSCLEFFAGHAESSDLGGCGHLSTWTPICWSNSPTEKATQRMGLGTPNTCWDQRATAGKCWMCLWPHTKKEKNITKAGSTNLDSTRKWLHLLRFLTPDPATRDLGFFKTCVLACPKAWHSSVMKSK